MAGIQALINQKMGGPQGNPNYTYYKLAAAEQGAKGSARCNSTGGTPASPVLPQPGCVFNDVTLGDIDVNCRGTTAAADCFGSPGQRCPGVALRRDDHLHPRVRRGHGLGLRDGARHRQRLQPRDGLVRVGFFFRRGPHHRRETPSPDPRRRGRRGTRFVWLAGRASRLSSADLPLGRAEGSSMKNASLRARVWASRLTPGLLVATVLMACGADTWSSHPGGGAGGASLVPSSASAVDDALSISASPALKASYFAARQHEGGPAYRFEVGPTGSATGKNAAHQVDVALADGAVAVNGGGSGGWHLGLRWTGLGRGAHVAQVASPSGEATLTENRASYRRADDSEEWYESGPLGVEQGFVLPAPPAGSAGRGRRARGLRGGEPAPVLARQRLPRRPHATRTARPWRTTRISPPSTPAGRPSAPGSRCRAASSGSASTTPARAIR